ncbi:MAG: O-antigen ligase domain-containing protein, partial [Nonlabens ulvanivorans]
MIQFEKLPYPLLIAGHIILTIFMIAAPFLIPLFFYASIIYFGLRVLLQKDSGQEALLACAYLVTLEVFLRMNQALIFYEFMKYLVIVFMIMGIIMRGFSLKSIPYVFYLLLLIPSIIVAAGNIPLGESLRKAVAFNLSGPVTLGITAIYCYQRTITNTRLDQILKLCVGPVVMITTYLFL